MTIKYFVNKDCLNSEQEYLKKGTMVELSDEDIKKEEKIISLGLIEKYDKEKHKVRQISSDVVVLKAEVEKYKAMVAEAITLAKGTAPEGWED